ncbi:hypothetical protein RCL1_006367 [Eukaryota sp. TZLM3-RCL]
MLAIKSLSLSNTPFGSSELASILRIRVSVVSPSKTTLPKDLTSPVLTHPATYKSPTFSWNDVITLSSSTTLLSHDFRFLFEVMAPTSSLPDPVTFDFPSFKGWTVFAWCYFQLFSSSSYDFALNSPHKLQLFSPPHASSPSKLNSSHVDPLVNHVYFWSQSNSKNRFILLESHLLFTFNLITNPEKPLPALSSLNISSRDKAKEHVTPRHQSKISPKLLEKIQLFNSRKSLAWSTPLNFSSQSPLPLTFHCNGISFSLFSSCGKFIFLALSSVLCPIVVLETYSFSQIIELPGHADVINHLSFTNSKKNNTIKYHLLSSSNDCSLSLWTFKDDGSYTSTSLNLGQPVFNSCFLQNNDSPSFLIATITCDGRIGIHQFDGKSLSTCFYHEPDIPINHLYCMAGTESLVVSDDQSRLLIYEITSSRLFLQSKFDCKETQGLFLTSLDGSGSHVLATCHQRGVSLLIDTKHLFLLQRTDISTGTIPILTPDHNYIIYLSNNNLLTFIKSDTGEKNIILNCNEIFNRYGVVQLSHHPLWHCIIITDQNSGRAHVFVGSD